jgi:hypothetical protein
MEIEALCDRTRAGSQDLWSGSLLRLPDGGLRLELQAQGSGLRHVEWPGFSALVVGQPRPERAPSAGEADPDPVHALLDAFERGGVSALRRVEGDWALVHWDGDAGQLHLAVDRLARHPLFLGERGDGWCFGGDPDALAAALGERPDPLRLESFRQSGALPGGATLYPGIRELPPGEHLRIRAGGATPDDLHAALHGSWRLEKRERRPLVLVAGEFAERLKSALRVLSEQGDLVLLAENPLEGALAAAALAQLPGPRSRLLQVPGWSEGAPEYWADVSAHFGLDLVEASPAQAGLGSAPSCRAWLERTPGLRCLAAALADLRGAAGRPLYLVSARGFDLALPAVPLPLLEPRAWMALRAPQAPPVAAIGGRLADATSRRWRPALQAALQGLPWRPAWPMLDETVSHFLANLPAQMRHGYPWSLDFRRRILRDLLPPVLRRPSAGLADPAAHPATART